MEAVASAVSRLGSLIARIPQFAFIALVCVVSLVRGGLWFIPPRDELLVANLRDFPAPMPWTESTSYGLRSLLWALRVENAQHLQAVTAAATLLCFAVSLAVIAYRFRGNSFRVMTMVLLLGPIATVLLGNIGRGDLLLLSGSLLVACAVPGRNWAWPTCLGAILMVSGNPEQAVLASTLLLAASFTVRLQAFRKPALVSLAICLPTFAILYGRSLSAGVPTRAGALTDNLKASIELFITGAPLIVYSGYAALWLMVGYALVNAGAKDRWVLGLTLIAAPLVLTASTLDQTRVWVGVTSLVMTALATTVVRDEVTSRQPRRQEVAVGVTLLAFVMMPALEATFEGIIRMPLGVWFAYGMNLLDLVR